MTVVLTGTLTTVFTPVELVQLMVFKPKSGHFLPVIVYL